MVQLRVLTLLLTGASLLMLFRLVRQSVGALPAALAVALLAVNPFFYSFTRLAVLEPAMIFFLLLALVLAARRPRIANALYWRAPLAWRSRRWCSPRQRGWCLLPGILYFLWAKPCGSVACLERRCGVAQHRGGRGVGRVGLGRLLRAYHSAVICRTIACCSTSIRIAFT